MFNISFVQCINRFESMARIERSIQQIKVPIQPQSHTLRNRRNNTICHKWLMPSMFSQFYKQLFIAMWRSVKRTYVYFPAK